MKEEIRGRRDECIRQNTPYCKHPIGNQQYAFPAIDIAQLADNRLESTGGEGVGSREPGRSGEGVKVGGDEGTSAL